jgi:CDP-diacylglycerol--serine O-phosphatidyltransferase
MGIEILPDTNEESAEHRGLRKGLYLLPAAFTTANVLMGFLAVIYSLRGFQLLTTDTSAASWYFDLAAKLIGFSILFDMLDGRLARMTKTTTELGIQLDSLADVLAFGIAPIVLVYCWAIGAVFPEDSEVYGLGVFVLFMYLMGGTFRLARFNVQSMRPRVIASGTPKIDKKNFVGLPIPPAAGLIAAIVHFKPRPLSMYDSGVASFWVIVMMFVLGVLALLMVSKLKYTSFKSMGTGKLNLYLILFIGGIGMSIWLYSRYVLLSIAISYVTHGVIWFILNLFRSPRKEIAAHEGLEEQIID